MLNKQKLLMISIIALCASLINGFVLSSPEVGMVFLEATLIMAYLWLCTDKNEGGGDDS